MAEEKTNTTVVQEEVNLDDVLGGIPGADNVATAGKDEGQEKPNFFSKDKVDMTVFENEGDDGEEAGSGEGAGDGAGDGEGDGAGDGSGDGSGDGAGAGEGDGSGDGSGDGEGSGEGDGSGAGSENEFEQILDENAGTGEGDDSGDKSKKKPGVKKVGEATANLLGKLIKDEKLIPFDDEKKLEDYTTKDLGELLEANLQETERKIREEVPRTFFESLPEELQVAAKYHLDGGKDFKGLFGALAQVEETAELDPTKEGDQEVIVKQYLTATQFGNSDEIQEEIDSWKDLGKLEAQANKFKPKLDKAKEAQAAQILAQQDVAKKKREETAQHYMDSVYGVLEKAELNGIKLDRKTQGMLYAGLVQPNYPSLSGKSTNLLGHLLEKHQFVEPNLPLVAEALWLLNDPEGYKKELKQAGANANTEETVRKLKTEQADKGTGSSAEEQGDGEGTGKKTISRPNDNFFKV